MHDSVLHLHHPWMVLMTINATEHRKQLIQAMLGVDAADMHWKFSISPLKKLHTCAVTHETMNPLTWARQVLDVPFRVPPVVTIH